LKQGFGGNAVSGMTVSEAVASRRTIRQYLDKPVPHDVLRRVMEKAQMSPSGCNFQPWEATILTGEPMRELSAKMLASGPQQPEEYAIIPKDIPGEYMARLGGITAHRMAAEGIGRDDSEKRTASTMRNFEFFGAPAVLLCYLPRVMGPPQWSDVGMWLQTVMLLLREEGLDSCPQESLAMHGRLIKDFLGVSDETHVFFCGLAIGYRDPDAPMNNYQRTREPLDEVVQFKGFA
jgi:nitroreductase